MKPLIINLAINGRDRYVDRQQKLIASLPAAGDCHHWMLNSYPQFVTHHQDIPYAFKFDLIMQAFDRGYSHVCWADSTVRFLKNPWDLLIQSEKGIVAFDNIGHPAWKYTSDKAAENLKKYYTDIKEVKQTWGTFFMLDFTKPLPFSLMVQVFTQMALGSFDEGPSEREGFVAARHDQTVLSYLFHHYQVPLLEYGIIAAVPDITEKTYIQYGD